MRALLLLFLLFLLLGATLSCSNGTPTEPKDIANLQTGAAVSDEGSWGNDYLWGYYEFLVNDDHTSAEQIPVRIADMHVNVRRFLEVSPCSACLKIISLSPAPGGMLRAQVEIRHPFLAEPRYTGFDVRVIFIVDGTYAFPQTNLVTSDASKGEVELANADGYTNLFNTVDFAPGSHGMPLFEYQQGKFATPGTFTSTLNGFKCYRKSIVRRHFATGGSETQDLLIDPPTGTFRMGYAINASWTPPNPNPPQKVPDDFSLMANCHEPYEVTAYLVEGEIVGNGYAHLDVELHDWQGISTVGDVNIEAPALHGGLKPATMIESDANWAKYEMSLSNEKYAPPGQYKVLIVADSLDADPNFGDIKAYQVIKVNVVANPMEPIWPMFRHDPRHTGKVEYIGPRTNHVEWKYFTDGYYCLHSSPTIGYDGTVYLGGDDMTYWSFHPDGTLNWHWIVGESYVDSSSCIDPYGNMYIVVDGITSNYGVAYGFGQDMVVDWTYQIGGWTESSPLIAADGTIIFGSRDSYVYAMNNDGSLKWKYKTGSDVRSSPAMDPYGIIYIGSHDHNLYAFDSDGNVKWTFPSSGPIFSSPCIDSQNRIYFGTLDNKVYCITQGGQEVWQYGTTGQHISSPGIDEEQGVIYIGCDDNYLYAINLDGTLRWKFPCGGVIRTSPAIDGDGYVYIRDRGPGWKIWCIDTQGKEVWQLSTESEYNYELSGSPSISDDGSLYIGCEGWVYCVRDE